MFRLQLHILMCVFAGILKGPRRGFALFVWGPKTTVRLLKFRLFLAVNGFGTRDVEPHRPDAVVLDECLWLSGSKSGDLEKQISVQSSTLNWGYGVMNIHSWGTLQGLEKGQSEGLGHWGSSVSGDEG